jgi:hypothetical protein
MSSKFNQRPVPDPLFFFRPQLKVPFIWFFLFLDLTKGRASVISERSKILQNINNFRKIIIVE